MSVTELARIKGVSKQAISKRLARLLDEGLIQTGRRGKETTVSLAEWDAVTNEVTDPARLVAQDTAASVRDAGEDDVDPSARKNPRYVEELTRKAGFEADRREIEVRKAKGELLETADVGEAAARVAADLVREIDQLPAHADDLAAAMTRSGVSGLREALRAKARELRASLSRAMGMLVSPDEATGDDDEDIAA